MKEILFLSVFISYSFFTYCQVPDWQIDEKYMYTSFFDDFNNPELPDWHPGLIYRGIGQLIDSSLTHRVQNGKLELTMVHVHGFNDSANYVGAEFITNKDFSFGIFECKASFAQGLGSWPAFWAFHSDCLNNAGPEIDFAEYFGKYDTPPATNELGHYIHHWICGGGGQVGTNYQNDYLFWPTTNIYKCIWNPDKVEFYIDGALKTTFYNNEIDWFPLSKMQVYISQQIIGPAWGYTPLAPQTSYFDWVKVKEYFQPPGITLSSDLICSSGTATIDVDSKAKNISWQLSPSNLFSTTNGSGLTANITTLSGASGLGTITFSFEMPSEEEFTAQKTFWVGPPSSAQFDMRNVDFYGLNYLYEGMTNQLIANDYASQPAITEWEWDYGGWYHWEVTSTKYISFVDVPSFSYRDISVRAKNQCPGASSWYTERFYPYEGFFLVFSPNPSTGETVLSIESASPEKAFDEITEWELEVYSETQLLKERKTRLKGKNTIIQTYGWQDGIYLVRVKYKEEVLTGKLVVKKM